jgi:sugar transferase (PEP-CTERM/EpsH1 system associated)
MHEILFLAHRFPYPPDRGDKIRSWHILKALAEFAPVHLCTLVDDERDFAHLETVEAVCASVHAERRTRSKLSAMARALVTGESASVAAFGHSGLAAKVKQILAERPIGCVFGFSGQMAQFVPAQLGGVRFVMDFVDVDSAKFQTYAEQATGAAAQANRFEGNRLAAFEARVARRADLSLFVSDAEAQLFRDRAGLGPDRVQALENGIDLVRFNPSLGFETVLPGDAPLIVFTGQMDYRPNIDAVDAFARETMPLIRAIDPDAQFAVVGRAPTDEVKALASLPGVIVTGEVPDTRAWLAQAAVVVAPLKLARGIQNKVLEAMAMGKAVVASSQAAEGIAARQDEALIVANGAPAEAAAVIGLIADPKKAAKIGTAARYCLEQRYSWAARLAPLKGFTFPEAVERAAA